MSDETRAALHTAVEEHLTAGDPDRAPLEEAARAHLDDVDPGYFDRISVELVPGVTLALEPHQRFVLPAVQAEYNELNDRVAGGDFTAEEAARWKELAHELAAATQARRVLEGRPMTTGAAPATASTSIPEA